ncbi:hypothetical protein [Rufibacter ruber]|uniref:hypothetical protein n=1 Tax=Rufibacter ruber TaxID=1783499 RepID=UPI000AFAE325|nr:hypothetical protein [Rufibacter ruber]
MKNFLLLAAIGMFGFASCKSSTCPAYATKPSQATEKTVLVKANPEMPAAHNING